MKGTGPGRTDDRSLGRWPGGSGSAATSTGSMATQSPLRGFGRTLVAGSHSAVVAGSVGEPAGVASVKGNTSTPILTSGRGRRGS